MGTLMTEYRFHWRPADGARIAKPSVTLEAASHLHGAAIALRQFMEQGCDIAGPLAHLDIVDANNAKQTLLVEEVLAWLHEPQQREFVAGAGLTRLIASDL
jgi:hypothetical protein